MSSFGAHLPAELLRPRIEAALKPGCVVALVELGIARELTGQRRNRVFVYDAYLAILNEGGEAL